MLKKINNYHIFILILIVFILNTILFKSIDITKAQWTSPETTPGEQETNIVVNPLQEDLNLGGQSIIGDGSIDITGTAGNTAYATCGDFAGISIDGSSWMSQMGNFYWARECSCVY